MSFSPYFNAISVTVDRDKHCVVTFPEITYANGEELSGKLPLVEDNSYNEPVSLPLSKITSVEPFSGISERALELNKNFIANEGLSVKTEPNNLPSVAPMRGRDYQLMDSRGRTTNVSVLQLYKDNTVAEINAAGTKRLVTISQYVWRPL